MPIHANILHLSSDSVTQNMTLTVLTTNNMASIQPAPSTASLQTLPPEIRNPILTLALVVDYPLSAHISNHLHPNVGQRAFPKPPPLAGVSRQIREEAIPIFYGANTFFIRGPSRWRAQKAGLSEASRWFAGISIFLQVKPELVRNVEVYTETLPCLVVTRHVCDDIIIEAEDLELSWKSAKCVCSFKSRAEEFIRRKGLHERDPVHVIVEAFANDFLPGEICSWDPRKTCGDSFKCKRREGTSVSIRIAGREGVHQ